MSACRPRIFSIKTIKFEMGGGGVEPQALVHKNAIQSFIDFSVNRVIR